MFALRSTLSAGAFLACFSIAQAGLISTDDLPKECHPSFVNAIVKADKASDSSENQLAIALLKGVTYPDGVRIKIEDESTGSYKLNAYQATWRSVAHWDKALGGNSPIKFMATTQEADITIKLVDKVPTKSADALGLIEMQKQYQWNKQQHIIKNSGIIYVQKQWAKTDLTEDQFTEVISHELGHLLGLADVANPGNLMGPMVPGQTLLEAKQHEVKALKLLRLAAYQRLQRLQAVESTKPNLNFLALQKSSANMQSYKTLSHCKH